jgi:hypothetical protein
MVLKKYTPLTDPRSKKIDWKWMHRLKIAGNTVKLVAVTCSGNSLLLYNVEVQEIYFTLKYNLTWAAHVVLRINYTQENHSIFKIINISF